MSVVVLLRQQFSLNALQILRGIRISEATCGKSAGDPGLCFSNEERSARIDAVSDIG